MKHPGNFKEPLIQLLSRSCDPRFAVKRCCSFSSPSGTARERSPAVRAKLKAIGKVYNIIGAVTFTAAHGQRTVDCGITEGDLNEHHESSRYAPPTPLEIAKRGNRKLKRCHRRRAGAHRGTRYRNNGSFETRLPFPFNDAYVSMGRSCCT